MPSYRACAGCGKRCHANATTPADGPLCRPCYLAVLAILRRLDLPQAVTA